MSEIARDVGVSRATVRTWLSRKQWPKVCPACGHEPHDFAALPERQYSYLLGMYLGDGTISEARGRRCFRLRIFMDAQYSSIVGEVAAAMRAVMPRSVAAVQTRKHARLVEINSYSNAWPCLFPQHGPGRKHERKIELAAWQQAIVEREPEQLVRGLLHSDGCRVMNRVVAAGKDYAYPRYFFTQVSKDIQGIFCRALDQLGIAYHFAGGGKDVSVARAAAVARLDTFVGPKS